MAAGQHSRCRLCSSLREAAAFQQDTGTRLLEWSGSMGEIQLVFVLMRLDALHFPGGSDSEESTCKAGDPGSIPGSGRSPWRREWQPTPVFLPGESHGQRSLVGYSPWGCKESDRTKQLTLSLPITIPDLLNTYFFQSITARMLFLLLKYESLSAFIYNVLSIIIEQFCNSNDSVPWLS